MVVHCAAGKDRTGLVTALALTVAGADSEVIGADYALTADRLVPYLEAELVKVEDEQQRQFYRDNASMPAEFMTGAVAHLDETYGGVEAYLRSGGMSDEQLTALRELLVDPSAS